MTVGSAPAPRWWRAAAWLGSLVAVLIALRLTGTGELARPPLTSLDGLERWADDRGPAASAIALVRFGAELVTWYLLGLSLLHAAAWASRPAGARSLAGAVALPGGRLVRTGLGIGLLASTAVPGESVEPARPPAGTATMQPIDDELPTGTATMRPLVEPEAVAAPTRQETAVTEIPRTHRVVDGESFWTIATEALEHAWGRMPTDPEIDPYWRALVDTNRSRLVSDDPDVVLPGQVFELPPPPAPTPT